MRVLSDSKWSYQEKSVLLIWVFALILAAPVDLAAQVTSTIQGYVSDPQGASVPGATVTAGNEETGVARSAISAEDGYYRIPDLLAGSYRLAVEMPGFKKMVRSGIVLNAKTVLGQNFRLEVGEVTDSITVSGQAPQVETQTARINDVMSEKHLQSLPMLGRTSASLVMTSPGITGKFESTGGYYCCDALGTLVSPQVSSGGNEQKMNYTVDGLSARYGDGAGWGLSFMPNPDAVQEVNVALSSYTAEMGSLSGPQIQLVTKGGTNSWHGTAHYTFREDELNAVPFRATRKDVPESYYRLFGFTLGGPIQKDRMFGFFAYEGRRAKTASSFVELAETQEFRDWVVGTRPNSIAAKLLQSYPPLRYPTGGLRDLNEDAVPDLGEVVVDVPGTQGGRQLNGRIDYHFPGGKDRIYGSYWYTRPSVTNSALRQAFANRLFTRVHYVNAAHSRAFSPNVLNEARFALSDTSIDEGTQSGDYHIPFIGTDDGISLGNGRWSQILWWTYIKELGDTLSINRGRHGIKLGGGYADRYVKGENLDGLGDAPVYFFASIFDFADDRPYWESRSLDVASGQLNRTIQKQGHKELYFFVQNTWQVRPNFTLNYGLRWENLSAPWLKLRGKENWQPVLTSEQLTPSAIGQVINQPVSRHAKDDLNNFGPRIGVAWDPTGRGKMSIRANFGILYDELNAVHMYNVGRNPPGTADLVAGPDVGTPIVYGLAPVGTRDFPTNPNLRAPVLTPQGGFEGTRVGLAAFATDLKAPLVYDSFAGVQYQVLPDLMVFGNYRYRRATNDVYADDLNRFEGDLTDGLLDRLNPHFNEIDLMTNWGKRIYHGLVFGAAKRYGQGWSLDAHYTYNHAKNNFPNVDNWAASLSTSPFKPELDFARDDIAHVFTFRNIWELPIFRDRPGWVGKVLGGWQLNSIWNLQSGPIFTPISTRRFGQGGDFNADGRRRDRPDLPTTTVPRSFGKSEWLKGPLSPDIFPLPAPSQPRPGTLPRDYFRAPGYARIDIAAAKAFRIGENAQVQFRAEAFNALNRVNISRVENRIHTANFAQATRAYLTRLIQFSLKLVF